MREISSILYYVEDEVDPAALNRFIKIAECAGARITLGMVVKSARSQVLCTRDSLDLDEIERLLVEDRRRQLDEAAKSVSNTKVEVATRVFIGDPIDTVIRAVQNDDFDLLAKLPTPTRGLRQQLFGGTDMRLMRACPCPVLVGRLKPEGYTGSAVVAVHYDEGDETKTSLNLAILDSVALVLGDEFRMLDKVYIVHAWSLYGESLLASGRGKIPPERLEKAKREEEARRRQWLEDLVGGFRRTLDEATAASFHPQLSLLNGDPAEVIPQTVKELDADVLAMGTVARSGLGGMLIGNTAEAILNRVECSVVTLKPEGFVSPVSPQ